MYVLTVPSGDYQADSLLALGWLVLGHRFWHWRQGQGWVD